MMFDVRYEQNPKEFFGILKIDNPISGSCFFKLRKFQEKIIDIISSQRINYFLKARQLGFSTIFAAYSYWTAVFKQNQKILFVTFSRAHTKLFFNKIKTWDAQLSKTLIKSITDNSILFFNGSTIRATNYTNAFSCGEIVDLLVVDEFAYIKDNTMSVMTALMPMVSKSGKFIACTSVPVDKQQFESFSKFWNFIKNNSDANIAVFKWYIDETKDYMWYKEQIESMGIKAVERECNCSLEVNK